MYFDVSKNINPVPTGTEIPMQSVIRCLGYLHRSVNIRKAKMPYNSFSKSRLRPPGSLNGQHWIFLRKGLDDFRDGFPPSSENMIVYGKKQPAPVILKSSAVKSSHTAPWNKSKKSSKIQLFKEATDIFNPRILFKSKVDYEQENQTLQEVQDHMEDKKMEETICKILAGKESRGKKTGTSLSKKVAAREKEATQGDPVPLDKYVKQVTKRFCDWVMSLGGGNWSIDEDALRSLLNTSCEREAALPVPFCAVKLHVPPEQSKRQEASPPKAAVRCSHQLGCLPCQVKEIEDAQLYSTQAFKEYLERKGYRKPQFLLKMLAGRNGNGAQEKMFQAFKK
ncbi:uncharacterized protein LOC107313358 isoform X2 [Coturnix japonica]|uniref:uncharacterized protein LOC107313358 isoform X2 n=1 Tax=Coturnix japonica TaxID=93934 RepID=UPI0013A5DE7F|nr:uncharacterized protein LOC107313358 isoform X2 [Coturnix japonica]